MEFLSQDREVGPELVSLLTEKLQKARQSMELLEQDNAKLKEELEAVRSHYHAPKREINELALDYTCQAGICPSIDKLNALSNDLREFEGKREKETQEHQTEILDLEMRLDRTKAKYNECTAKYQESQAEITRLQECINSTKTKYKECKARLTESSIEATRLQERLDRTKIKYLESKAKFSECHKELSELRSEQSTVNSTLIAEEAKATSSECRTPDMQGELTPEDQSRTLQELISTPCLTPDIKHPLSLAASIRVLSNGVLFYPNSTEFEPSQPDTAYIYLPRDKCTPDDPPIWMPDTYFDRHLKQTRDLFHKNSQGQVCYAGTFECLDETDLSPERFLYFGQPQKTAVLEWTFSGPIHIVPQQIRDHVRNMYETGHRTIRCFRLLRVGFNLPLHKAMMAAVADYRAKAESSVGSSRKRKSNRGNQKNRQNVGSSGLTKKQRTSRKCTQS